MSEKCPLVKGDSHWSGTIPDICWENCEPIWDELPANKVADYDDFKEACEEDPECIGSIEHSDSALQSFGDRKRGYTILNVCSTHGTEISNENFVFECQNPQ
jgi:hypothetical protein